MDRTEGAGQRRLAPAPAHAWIGKSTVPALDHNLRDDRARLGVQRCEVLPEPVRNGCVVEVGKLAGEPRCGVDHQAASGPAGPRRSQHVRGIEQHAERAPRCGEGVQVVPRHGRGLAGEEGADDIRPVWDGRECRRRVRRQVRDNLPGHVGWRGNDDRRRPGLVVDPVLRPGDRHARGPRPDRGDPGAEPHPVSEASCQRVDDLARSAEDVPGQARRPVPHEVEVPDPIARGELFGLTRRSRERRPEEQVHVLRKRTSEVRERAVIHEPEHPTLSLSGVLAGDGLSDPRVAPDRQPETEARPDEGDPRSERHREAEREGFHAARGDSPAVQ